MCAVGETLVDLEYSYMEIVVSLPHWMFFPYITKFSFTPWSPLARRRPLVSIGEEAGWASEPIQTLRTLPSIKPRLSTS
jgi:hypothetical protein